jgi:hypothetical protein
VFEREHNSRSFVGIDNRFSQQQMKMDAILIGDRIRDVRAVACQSQHIRGALWLLVCESCGREKFVSERALLRGRRQLCPCQSDLPRGR